MSLHGNLVAVASRWLLKLFFLKSHDVLDAVLGTDLGEQRCFKFLIRQFVSLNKTKIICSMTDRKPFVTCGFCGVKISPVIGCNQGGAHDSNSVRYLFRVPMIHRFMTSHPVAELLLCFRAKHQDGRPMPFGFLVIFTHRLTELCILNAENVEKVSSRPFKQIS